MKACGKKVVALLLLLCFCGMYCATLAAERDTYASLEYAKEEFYEEPEIVYRSIGVSDFGLLCREAGKE